MSIEDSGLTTSVGDYVGRTYLPSLLLVTSPRRILSLSLARTGFIPLFLGCNVMLPNTAGKGVWINSDLGYFLILLSFGLSNG